MTIKPLSNRVVVRKVKSANPYGGMLAIPETALDDLNTGGPKEVLVIAVGPGRRNVKGLLIPVECAPGDRAIIHSYTNGPEPLGNGDLMITDDQILAVIPK